MCSPTFVVVDPADQHTRPQAATKAQLDQLHRHKIAMADAVLVVTDPSGYYGTSTHAEIGYALQLGMPVDVVAVDLDTGTHTITARLNRAPDVADVSAGLDTGDGACVSAPAGHVRTP